MIPVPVLIAYGAIAGWPTLKLASVIARRVLRRSMRAAAKRFDDDSAYSEADRHIVRDLLVTNDEPMAIMATPAVLLIAICLFVFSRQRFSEICQKAEAAMESYRQRVVDFYRNQGHYECTIHPNLMQDPIFRKIDNVGMVMALLRYPVSFLLSVVVVLLFGWVVVAVKGFRSWKSTLKAMFRISTQSDRWTLSFN